MSRYRLQISSEFYRQLKKVNRQYGKVIIDATEKLVEQPLAGKALKGQLSGLYSLRVGKYRVLYQIEKRKLIILVLTVKHRKDVYR
jgi:mRNA interferase RelE/StbE